MQVKWVVFQEAIRPGYRQGASPYTQSHHDKYMKNIAVTNMRRHSSGKKHLDMKPQAVTLGSTSVVVVQNGRPSSGSSLAHCSASNMVPSSRPWMSQHWRAGTAPHWLWHSGGLTVSLTSCSTFETRPCTSLRQHSRADSGSWVSHQRKP